jgi:hypothetical protein
MVTCSILWLSFSILCSFASSFSYRAPFLGRQTFTSEQQKHGYTQLWTLILEEDFSLQPTKKATELWLDLRGTAVHPRVAIDYILEQLREDGSFLSDEAESGFIDRVLLSDRHFQSLLESSDTYVETSEILYETDDTDGLVALSRNSLSMPFGILESMPSDGGPAVADPMKAMQTLSEGKWIILSGEEEEPGSKAEILRIEAIDKFLDIASAAKAGNWGSTSEMEGGLLLRADVPSEDESSITAGGVAVVCSTKSVVVGLASILQVMQSGLSISTESGIILQGSSDGSSSSLPTALILSFDVGLWKAAVLVYGEHELYSNNE